MIAELSASHCSSNTFQIHGCLRQVCKFLIDRSQDLLTSCKVHDGNSFSKFYESVSVTELKPGTPEGGQGRAGAHPAFQLGEQGECCVFPCGLADGWGNT